MLSGGGPGVSARFPYVGYVGAELFCRVRPVCLTLKNKRFSPNDLCLLPKVCRWVSLCLPVVISFVNQFAKLTTNVHTAPMSVVVPFIYHVNPFFARGPKFFGTILIKLFGVFVTGCIPPETPNLPKHCLRLEFVLPGSK